MGESVLRFCLWVRGWDMGIFSGDGRKKHVTDVLHGLKSERWGRPAGDPRGMVRAGRREVGQWPRSTVACFCTKTCNMRWMSGG